MESRVKLLGHPLHQILIVFPLGLLGMAVFFDVIGLIFSNANWQYVAFWMMGAGIVTGLIAAPFGTIDWFAIPKHTRAKRVGLLHGIGNVAVVILFAIAFGLRYDTPAEPSGTSLFFSFVGLAVALVTGWLGGELVNRLGVGISDDVNLDAPSSLRRDDRTPFRATRDRAA